MITLKIYDKKTKKCMKDIGVEIFCPVVSEKKVYTKEMTKEIMANIFPMVQEKYCQIPQSAEMSAVCMIEMFRKDMEILHKLYQKSFCPDYLQLLYQCLLTTYGVFGIPMITKALKRNYKYIHIVFANCQSEYQAKDVIPVICSKMSYS